jgi:molybdate transport system ATP-binding protein
MIEIRVRHRVGALVIDADVRSDGRSLALCGASGAGKTTLLNIIAGLVRPDEGRVAVDGNVFLDTAAGIDLPVRSRALGYVFQEPRLFPHLSVRGNLNYGVRFARGRPPLVSFEDVVALLGISPLLARRPGRLSGGEKQRVAIGRALLMSPRALLLDEPLTGIDDSRRGEILALIETLRDRFTIPMILVSHRPDEIDRLASDIVMLRPGQRTVAANADSGRLGATTS